ncbi:hypothetical protein GOL39_28685 [Sinorhizobium medicae]|nr:hypothetical protein [Sinorhizobium medicae]MDX0973774.1 hypothetical protein [Sinorhizobium medicae]MDX1146542.1 hypothetical protein [Sinorhizobium medicae]
MDTSGPSAFFNDDKNQFVEVWHNTNGNVTVKVSNGRPWRPMWVVAHVVFRAGKDTVANADYHVYCKSPNPGGGGEENWFVYPGPGVFADSLSVTTNKEDPWGHPKGGWTISISVSGPMPDAEAEREPLPENPRRPK